MTFILNLLHKDFSLIAADLQGNSDGPSTIQIGGTKIHVNGKLTINGLRKILTTKNRKIALGIAGTVADHSYQNTFLDEETPEGAMKVVRNHMESFYSFSDRDLMLEGKPQMENQALISFFDEEKSAYFTSMSFFTKFSNATSIYARCKNPSPTLCHIGSGSNQFEKAVGLDEINSFIRQVAEGANLSEQLSWFEQAFSKVSAVAAGCGADFIAVLSTRESPQFTEVKGGSPADSNKDETST